MSAARLAAAGVDGGDLPLGGGLLALVRPALERHVHLGTDVAASIADDDPFIALVMIVALIVIPRLASRFVTALRPDAH